MKTLYITTFLLAGIISIQAQENKSVEQQDNIQHIKDSKAFEQKMMKQQSEKKAESKTAQLASEQGLEQKNKIAAPQAKSSGSSGKLIPNNATLEEILASIPNRKVVRNTDSKPTNVVKGLPSTATLEEIKKTIPKDH